MLLVVLGAALCFLLLTWAVVAHAVPVVRLDTGISGAAHRAALSHPAWRQAAYAVTRTADTNILIPVVAAASLLLLRRGRWREWFFVAAAMAATSGIRLLVLAEISRPRPTEQLAPASGWSFPSGHTTASATVALIVAIVCRPMLRRRRSRIVLVGTAATWAAAVGVSRVALVVHWPSDVVGAWLLVLVLVPAVAVLVGLPRTES